MYYSIKCLLSTFQQRIGDSGFEHKNEICHMWEVLICVQGPFTCNEVVFLALTKGPV